MQADVVIAFTLPVDLMSLDAREGTAEEENVFESRIDWEKFEWEKMKDTGLYIYVHAIGFECKQLSTVREATTGRKGRARLGRVFYSLCSRPYSIEACGVDREA